MSFYKQLMFFITAPLFLYSVEADFSKDCIRKNGILVIDNQGQQACQCMNGEKNEIIFFDPYKAICLSGMVVSDDELEDSHNPIICRLL